MHKDSKGLAFIFVLLIILVVTMIAGGFITVSMNEIKAVRRQNNSTRAFYLADAGIEHAKSQLHADWNNQTAIDNDALGEGDYVVNFYNTDFEGNTLPAYQLRVRSTGTVDGVSRTVEVVLGSASRFSGGANVTCAIEAEGALDIRGTADINGQIKAEVSTTLSSDAGSGSTSIVVDDTTNFSADDDLVIDTGGAQEETNSIVSVDESTSSITLDGGLSFDHTAGTIVHRTLSFERVFGVSKEEMKEVAQECFPTTYYSSAFDNDGATGLTWVDAVGEESQITYDGWTGDGILIVEGDLKLTGGTFNGVIWVEGTLTISGNPVVHGGVFVECGITVDTVITGTAEISYDSDSIDDAFLNITSISPTVEAWRETL